jgi:hypothetical protein
VGTLIKPAAIDGILSVVENSSKVVCRNIATNNYGDKSNTYHSNVEKTCGYHTNVEKSCGYHSNT